MTSIRRFLHVACMSCAASPAWAGTAPVVQARGAFDYTVAPSALSFHGAFGVPSPTRNVTLSAPVDNAGAVVFSGCIFGGSNAGDFAMAPAPGYPLSVAAGASVHLPVRFTAGALGSRTATLTCQSMNGTSVGGSFPVTLNGTGVINTLDTPPTLAFDETPFGSVSAPLNVIASAGAGNTGNVTITACSIGGVHALDFLQVPAAMNLVVAPGASVGLPVIFAPTEVGMRTATLTCTMNTAPSVTFDVALSGITTMPAQTTVRVSVASGGAQGDDESTHGSISADGRLVAFASDAANLVPGDVMDSADVFVHDRQTIQTQRVSVSTSGASGFDPSFYPSISADGRHVAFLSAVDSLVPVDSNGLVDVFVRDRQTGQTERVSVASSGAQATGSSFTTAISADGRHVAFSSSASNLVPADTNFANDVFVHDRQTRQTHRVSISSGGGEAFGSSARPALSGDGRFVAFESSAWNLAADDSNGADDVFVHDRQTGQTQRVSVPNGGVHANNWSRHASISADGRYIAFESAADNLVPGDNNLAPDVFVHDRGTGRTLRMSVSTSGIPTNGPSHAPSISASGRHVAFVSDASNLAPDDTNATSDVFVRDRHFAQTERASVSTGDWDGGGESWAPSISADGRHVAFTSLGTFVAADTNGVADVYVRDRGDLAMQDRLFRSGFEPW